MKKLPALFLYAFFCAIILSSCTHSHGNIDVSYGESDRYYTMNANFRKSQTWDVEQYMDSRLGGRSNVSFASMQIDGTLTLDDQTTVYVKKSPGMLKIKLDKYANSDEALARVRSMCQGLKTVLTK